MFETFFSSVYCPMLWSFFVMLLLTKRNCNRAFQNKALRCFGLHDFLALTTTKDATMCWLKVRPAGAAIQSRLQPKREASELKEKKKKTPAL